MSPKVSRSKARSGPQAVAIGTARLHVSTDIDFSDSRLVRRVELRFTSRRQRVYDGSFEAIDEVRSHALTLIIPALMAAKQIHTTVSDPTRAEAVRRTLKGSTGAECPAAALRQHHLSYDHLDRDSAALVWRFGA